MYLGGLGQLNFKKLNSLALSGDRLGLDGGILCLHRFFDSTDLIFGLLVNTGEGGLGKSVRSLKSFHMRFHLFLRICFTEGLHCVYLMHNGVGLSLSGLHFLGASMAVLCVCFSFQTCFNMCFL